MVKIVLPRQMAAKSARERCGVGRHGVGNPRVLASTMFRFFFAFDTKSYVLWVAKQKV